MYSAFRERERTIYSLTLWLALATVLFTYLDVNRYELVTTERFEFSNYLSLESQEGPLEIVDHVRVRCILFDPGDNGERKLGLGYALAHESGREIELLRFEEESDERIEALEIIDRRLREAGVPVLRAEKAGFLLGDRVAFVEDCRAQTIARYGEDKATKLMNLLATHPPPKN